LSAFVIRNADHRGFLHVADRDGTAEQTKTEKAIGAFAALAERLDALAARALASMVAAARRLAKQHDQENQRGGNYEHPSQLGALIAQRRLLEIADVCPGPGGGDHRFSTPTRRRYPPAQSASEASGLST
jgi:hypothetical protein